MAGILSPEILPFVIQGLKLAFVLALFRIAWLLIGLPVTRQKKPLPSAKRLAQVLLGLFLPVAALVLVYQGSWQLTGFARPKFVAFMRKYNRRHLNPVKHHERGRILDRSDRVLAIDDPKGTERRQYPGAAATAHVVGYADRRFGLSGVEAAENAYLDGYSLASAGELSRFGRNMLSHTAVRGSDLALALDLDLQRYTLRQLGERRGAAVAIRPRDGAVLLLVSTPGFDPNKLSPDLFSGSRRDAPLLNRATQGLYPPGSTFKLVVAAAALERGVLDPIDCPAWGFAAVPGARPIRDHEFYACQREGRAWRGHGRIGMNTALARSSNVFFAQLGVVLGNETLNEAAARFAFGERLPLLAGSTDMWSATASRIPAFAPGMRREMAQVSIGQGELLMTPLHLAVITAAIANDGVMYPPRLKRDPAAASPRRVLAAQAARELKEMMRGVVLNGTGRRARIDGVPVAGKTGTAQAAGGDDHSWFTCFAPCPDAELAVTVLIERGGSGARAALPVARAILVKARELGLLAASKGGADGG